MCQMSCYTRTRFISLTLTNAMRGGIPIGQGPCKAVRLSANHFELYREDRSQSSGVGAKFYYGDSQQQTKEYLINTDTTATGTNNRSTDIIPCTDLSQIFIRFTDPTPNQLVIEVEIFD